MQNTTYKMDNHSTHAQVGGAVLGIAAYVLHVDWSHAFTTLLSMNIWQILFDFGIQILKVGVAGFVGGAAGKYGGQWIEKKFPSKTKKKTIKP